MEPGDAPHPVVYTRRDVAEYLLVIQRFSKPRYTRYIERILKGELHALVRYLWATRVDGRRGGGLYLAVVGAASREAIFACAQRRGYVRSLVAEAESLGASSWRSSSPS